MSDTEHARAGRKGLSKRTRFEVFKRDGFKCQYCGNTPPSVVLEIDHCGICWNKIKRAI